MSDTQANKQAIEDAYLKWNECKGDNTDMWVGLVADNAQLGSVAAGMLGGEFAESKSGSLNVSDFLGEMTATWKMLDWKVGYTVAEGDNVMIYGKCSWKHKGTGKDYESPIMSFFRFENEKVVEFYEIMDTQALVKAATPSVETAKASVEAGEQAVLDAAISE